MFCSLLACLFSTSLLFAPPTAFLEQHCYDCHDTENKKGDLDLTALTMDALPLDLLNAPRAFGGMSRNEPEVACP